MLYNFSSINDNRIKYNNILPSNTYHKFCKNYYSQNGEDGILEQLLKELEIKMVIVVNLVHLMELHQVIHIILLKNIILREYK